MLIAIDGPAASGKGTAAKQLAKKLKFRHIDSGAFYRVVAFYVFNMEMDPARSAAVVAILPKINVTLKSDKSGERIFSRGRDITDEIRYHLVSGISSQVSSIPQVRKWVNSTVRKLTRGKNAVVEGRDIATKVFPNADFKFYLDASLEERAKRRHLELQQRGSRVAFRQVKRDLADRDELDKNKPEGELKIARDAIYVDSTNMSSMEVVDFMNAKVKNARSQVKKKRV
ncbi:(d)CMP kinase [Patescibacteria group bacterium]